MEKLAIIIVTYNRQDMLAELLDSIESLTQAPWRVVVVDNANDLKVERMVARMNRRDQLQKSSQLQQPKQCDQSSQNNRNNQNNQNNQNNRFVYLGMPQNLGGSGGFYTGMKWAYEAGASWFWIMDDDVTVEPRALDVFDTWVSRYCGRPLGALQGQRKDVDSGPFFWQHRMLTPFAIYNPLVKNEWKTPASTLDCNVLCFEGALVARHLVQKIGYPDPRFFIYLDDACYGYVASKHEPVVYVQDFVLQRRRKTDKQEIGKVRQLNSTSDMTRYYITRNRAYLARYLQVYGDYNPVSYAIGTVLTFAKEWIRLLLVDRDHLCSGTKRLWAGYKESRRILHDTSWHPMSPVRDTTRE